ncbi:MAG: lipoprotein signal peptidase, partial [Gammaproteobacteria bacterium]|nr:lipoprotein signal peptidase [Gammaproteobacteria bacterium]
DLWSKSIASEYLLMHQPVPVFPGLNMTLMHNYGAAFSFLSNAGGWQRWFFTILALAVSAFIIGWLRKLEKQQTFLAIALALVLGGALANVWDRITLGYVVDFIDVYYQQWHWPAFNIADSAICVGAVMLIIDALFFQHHTEKK